ncbi:MAG: RICIN domain-containing protein, partial [Pseudoflavonifractor sp.]
ILNNYQKNITRAEFCKLVVNFYKSMGGEVPAVSQSPFTDTADNDILIASKLGIVNGTSATTFEPHADITREQISAMMMRAEAIAWTNLQVDDQLFIIERNRGKFSIKALHSQKALTPVGAQANGTAVVQKTFSGSDDQFYDIADGGGGYVNIITSDGLYVSVSAGSPDKGTPIILWEKTGNISQKFNMVKQY